MEGGAPSQQTSLKPLQSKKAWPSMEVTPAGMVSEPVKPEQL